MTILIECTCGQKFDIETNLKRHKPSDESIPAPFGSGKCPNPKCKRWIQISVILTEAEDVGRNDLIDWDTVKDGDSLYHSGLPFEVAYKTARNEGNIKILGLRSLFHGENVIAEVDNTGHISFVPWKPYDNNPFNVYPPQTSSGFESWTEEGLELIKNIENPTSSEKIYYPGDCLNWEYIQEGQLLSIGDRHYHIIFKTMWESSKSSDTRKVLYLESLENGEHLIAGVEEDDRTIFMIHRDNQSIIQFDEERPYTSAGFESWTDEEMAELKNHKDQKIDKTNCQLCGTPVDTQLWEELHGLCEGCSAGVNACREDEWID